MTCTQPLIGELFKVTNRNLNTSTNWVKKGGGVVLPSMNLLFYGMWCGIQFYFPMCFFHVNLCQSVWISRFWPVVFVVKKEGESLDVFSVFVGSSQVRNREVTWVWSHLRNLYEPSGLPPKIPAAPNVKIGHQMVFQESLGIPHLNHFFALTIHKIPTVEPIGWFDPKTYFRKEVLSEMLRWPLTWWNTYSTFLNFCFVPKQLGKSS